MIRYKFVILSICFALIASPAFSKVKVKEKDKEIKKEIKIEELRVAIMDLAAKDIDESTAHAVSSLIRSDMIDSKLFVMIEREQMNGILQEQGFQQVGAIDPKKAVQMGKLLAANKLMIGEITRMGKSLVITVRIVDIENGVAEYSAKGTAADEEKLQETARKVSKDLILKISGLSESEYIAKRHSVSLMRYYMREIFVPSMGQFYTDHDAKGLVFMGAFVGTLGFATYSMVNFLGKKKDYEGLPYGESQDTYDKAWSDYQGSAKMVNYSFLSIGVVYVINWLDILFFSTPRETQMLAGSGIVETGFSMNACFLPPSELFPEEKNFGVSFNFKF